MAIPLNVYISYSQKDERLKEQLVTYLSPLHRQGLITIWDSSKIVAGDPWKSLIDHHMSHAQIFLLLVSPNYIASDYCYQFELPHAMERYRDGKARVLPILLSKIDWFDTPLRDLQVLPRNAKPITEWRKRSQAFITITEDIKRLVYDLHQPINLLSDEHLNAGQPLKGENIMAPNQPSGTTLIIHGHAEKDLYELRHFLQNILELPRPVVMGGEIVPGLALPAKFEHLAQQVNFAIALLTPDDEGKALAEADYHPRARQNTLIEIGWFWGRLGLGSVLLLVKNQVEIPSDLQGLEYYNFAKSPTECSEHIRAFYRVHRVPIK